jgi:uncharacterized membrane protein YdcZ (DUF606 family)
LADAAARIVSRWTESRNKVQNHFMNTIKQRRYLIRLCIASFIAWIVTSFALIVLWYVKGNSVNSDAFMVWHMFVFEIIPGYTSGYLLFGLFLLNFIMKTKTTNETK